MPTKKNASVEKRDSELFPRKNELKKPVRIQTARIVIPNKRVSVLATSSKNKKPKSNF